MLNCIHFYHMTTGFSGSRKKCFHKRVRLICNINDRFVLATILLFVISGYAVCQNVPAEKIMGIPQEYIISEINGEKGNTIGTRTGTIWEVFSACNENKTYSTYEGQKITGETSFLESFFVTNQIGEYLHIYSDPKPDKQNSSLSSSAVDRGWINKNSVLLWRHCLIDRTSRRNIMALTFSHSSVQDLDSPDQLQGGGIDAFFDPDFKENRHIRTQAKQIYYIYNKAPDAVLLGKDPVLTFGLDPRETIIGWIPTDQCYIPETRLWITPNTDPAAIDEMKAKNAFPALVIDRYQASQIQTNSSIEKRTIIWIYDPDKDQDKWNFFPLEETKDGLLKVRVVEDGFKTAYASAEVSYMENPLFKIVTLLSNEQLFEVISNLHIINEMSDELSDRIAFRKCLLDMQRKKTPDKDDDEVLNLTIKALFESLFWVSNSTDPAMGMKLRKINDPAMVGDAFITSFLKKIKSSEDELKKITLINQKEVSFLSFNTRYFWIDLHLFF
jgi:hypothetical protein